jgi:hypothetical protein
MGKKRTDPNWKKLREQLWARSGGMCEITARPLDPETFDAHHRRPKSLGGTYRELTDSLVNLLALDPEVHNGAPWSVHQKPEWSRPRGYLLSSHLDDAQMSAFPVLYRGRTWVTLDQEGGTNPTSGADMANTCTCPQLPTAVPGTSPDRWECFRDWYSKESADE